MEKEFKQSNFLFFLISSLIFYLILIVTFFCINKLINFNNLFFELRYSIQKNSKIEERIEILKIKPSFAYDIKKRKLIFFDKKGNIVYVIKKNIHIKKIFNFYFENGCFCCYIGIKLNNRIFFINLFYNFENFLKLFIFELPILFAFIFVFSQKLKILESRKSSMELLNSEIRTNNNIISSLLENFYHKFSTSFEIINYLDHKKNLTKEDFKILKNSLKEFKEFYKKLEDLQKIVGNNKNSFYELIKKGFALSSYQNLMYSNQVNIDKKLKEYKPLQNNIDNIVIMIFFKISKELMELNFLTINIFINNFSFNYLSLFIFEVDLISLNDFNEKKIENLLNFIDGKIKNTGKKIKIVLPAKKIKN